MERSSELGLDLEQRTQEIRGFCQKVKSIMDDGLTDEVRKEMAEEIPDLFPINGEKEPVKRMLELFRSVAEAVKQASGHDFDTVINPCSGSDVSAGLSFGCNNIVTIDEGDLFLKADNTDDGIRNRLKRNLRGKLVSGMHGFSSNQGLVAYAMELVLNDVDIDLLEVIAEKKVGYMTMIKVKLVKDGKQIIHTNFSHVNLKTKFNPSKPEDKFLQEKITSLIAESTNPLLLSKAAGESMVGANIATTSFYPLLRYKTVVVSDVSENGSLKASGALLRLENLKSGVIYNLLNQIQGGSKPQFTKYDGTTDKYIMYGYATDLTNLEILKVTSAN